MVCCCRPSTIRSPTSSSRQWPAVCAGDHHYGCGGAEFIVDGHNGYVCDALDIPALQQAVMALPPRALGSAEGGHARERIMACTSERLSTQLLSLYQDLVN